MIITLHELRALHPTNNYVVLRPEVNTEKIQYGTVEFHAPVSSADGKPYDAFSSQPIVCSVMAVPRRLIFGTRFIFWETIEELDVSELQKFNIYRSRKDAKFSEITTTEVPIPGSMPWKTTMQLKQDDIVWVNNNALLHAEQKGLTISIDGTMYYIIKYDDIYLKKSADDVVMLNGYVLAELVEDSPEWAKRAEKAGLVVPDNLKHEQFNDRIGVIRYIGDPVEYMFNDRYDGPGINVCDFVYFKWKINRRLEPGQKYFAKDADLIVTRRCNILGVME